MTQVLQVNHVNQRLTIQAFVFYYNREIHKMVNCLINKKEEIFSSEIVEKAFPLQ
jgi:hypothetical protein